MRRLFLALLIVLAVLFLVGHRSTSAVLVMTGDVVDWHPGWSITVANEQTDPGGVRINVRAADHDGDRDAIRSGARVAVWSRSVGELYPVAVKVRVLDPR